MTSVKLFADNTIITYLTLTAVKKTPRRYSSFGEVGCPLAENSILANEVIRTMKKIIYKYLYTPHGQILTEEKHTKYIWFQ